MKKQLLSLFAFVLFAAALTSCGAKKEEKKDEAEATQAEATAQTCTYTYDKAGTMVTWTAYKFTDKTGVSGKFDQFDVAGNTTGDSPKAILENLAFEIPVQSVNSNEADRDAKIKAQFFGTMIETEMLSGKIASITGDDSKGTLTFDLNMNGQTKQIQGDYTIDETGLVKIKAEMDVLDWGAGDALAALNKVCEELHKGSDGVSKLWPNVTLSIQSQLKKECK